MIDFNCFVGHWPFHKLRLDTFEKIKNLHLKNGIEYGYISSLDSIFYNDFYESEKELYHTIKNSGYKQVITVNPALEGCANSIMKCIEEFDVAGIRVFPGFHDYCLDSIVLKPVVEIMKKYKLPLFITLRLEDERNSYIIHPKPVEINDMRNFIEKNNEIPILLCDINYNEIYALRDLITENPNIFYDVSGLKNRIFEINDLGDSTKKMVYGSSLPISCITSTLLLVEEELEDVQYKYKDKIKTGEAFINACL